MKDAKTSPKDGRLSKKTMLLLDAFLVVLALAVSLGLAEILLRAYEDQILASMYIDSYLPPLDDSVMCVDLDDETRFERFAWDENGDNIVHIHSDNPILTYELRPSSRVSTHIKTNAHGFRDREFTLEKEVDVFRICVIGDSISFGWLLKQDELYSSLLEAKLNQWPEAPYRFQVYNLAIDGYNAEQEAELIRSKCLQFNPDLIVIGFCANDDAIGADAGLWRHFSRGPSRTIDMLKLKWRQIKENYRNMGMLEHSYRAIAQLLEENDIALCVVLFPHADDPFDHSAQMLQFGEKYQIPMIDLRPAYEAVGLETLLPDQVHPTAQGHAIAADHIVAFVKERFAKDLLPASSEDFPSPASSISQ